MTKRTYILIVLILTLGLFACGQDTASKEPKKSKSKFSLSITDKSNENVNYTFSEIEHSDKNVNVYYETEIGGPWRRMNAWIGYSYIKLRFTNKKTYFITSLIADIENFPIKCKETHYDLFLLLRQKDWETIKPKNYSS